MIIGVTVLVIAGIVLAAYTPRETQGKIVTVSGIVKEYKRYQGYESESYKYLDVKIDNKWYLIKDLPSSKTYGLGGGITYTSELFVISLLGKEITFTLDYYEDPVLEPKNHYKYIGMNSKDIIMFYLDDYLKWKMKQNMNQH